ncbi:MAG: hypothetical protein M3160_03465 [Candidatus Eremiobacteraeota bacterium]|nr:hypothetical protein [Candidatus Eremiobacteraeota bacterium]
MRRGGRRIDLGLYLRAFPLLVKNPIVIVPPLVAALLGVLISSFTGPFTDPLGGFGAGLLQFLAFLVDMFLFGVSLIIAQTVWRRGRATFDVAWNEAQEKAMSILFAAVGFQFVIYAAGLVGGVFGPFGYLLAVVAVYFLIYTIPAAAIGGIPGGAALSASIERVKDNYLAAGILCIVSLVLYAYFSLRVIEILFVYIGSSAWAVEALVQAVVKAIVVGYLAFVFAKQYDEIAF